MDYKKIYDSLISRGKTRILEGYFETHHIVPRCLGGCDDLENLVKLTPEEHYIAHQLLIKIYPNNYKLIRAAVMMIPNRPSNKLYGWLRRKFSIAQSKSQSGKNNSQYGSKWIHNPLTKESKKIKGEVEDGWFLGKYKSPKPKVISKKEQKINQTRVLYNNYHQIYNKLGFEKFVEVTGYTKSQQNLVQMLSKHVESFMPQNGKKR